MPSLIIAVVGLKGGVGKTTASVHLAGSLNERSKTLLVDGDSNRSSLAWAEQEKLPFMVVDEQNMEKIIGEYETVVIDTAARPSEADLRELAESCDLIILPALAESMSLRAVMQTALTLHDLGTDKCRVLLNIVPPKPSREGQEAREALVEAGLPVFAGSIRAAVAFRKASGAGCLVSEIPDPRAAVCWGDYRAVSAEIMEITGGIK